MKQWAFRAWDKSNNVMAGVTSIDFAPSNQTGKFTVRVFDGAGWHKTLYDFELMAYTGYKDRNKKKIYQMDIVEVHGETLMAVVWHAGGFCLINEEAMLERVGWYLPEGFGNIPEYAMEVKGNLYQDKHLLKRFKS